MKLKSLRDIYSLFTGVLCSVATTSQSILRKHGKMSYTLISTGNIYSIYTVTQYQLSSLPYNFNIREYLHGR